MNPRTMRLLSLLYVSFALTLFSTTEAAVPREKPELTAWQKKVFDAIGTRWYQNVQKSDALVHVGSTRISFRIMPDGRIKNLKILSNTSNEASANICIQSVRDAKIPPIPKNVLKDLAHDWLDVDIPFTIYAN